MGTSPSCLSTQRSVPRPRRPRTTPFSGSVSTVELPVPRSEVEWGEPGIPEVQRDGLSPCVSLLDVKLIPVTSSGHRFHFPPS